MELGARQPDLVLRALVASDEAELVRIHRTPEVRRWWDEPEDGFPWSDDPGDHAETIYPV